MSCSGSKPVRLQKPAWVITVSYIFGFSYHDYAYSKYETFPTSLRGGTTKQSYNLGTVLREIASLRSHHRYASEGRRNDGTFHIVVTW